MRAVVVLPSGAEETYELEGGDSIVSLAMEVRRRGGNKIPCARFMQYEIDRVPVPRGAIGTFVLADAAELRIIV